MNKVVQTILVSLALVFAYASAQTVTVGLFQDPPHLDPALSTATSEYVVLTQIFDTLLTFDDAGEVAPNLATDWTISEDGLTYTFKLRDDVTFHDGTPFNAEAVKFSLERTMNMPEGAFVEQLSVIDSINVIDDYTVEIKLTKPQGSFLTYMADRSSTAVSPTAAQQGDAEFDANPVGTGPFKFVSRVQQDNITLERFDDYWDGAPAVESVVFKFFPDGSVRFANLRSGAVDIIYPIESKDYITAQNDAGINLLRQPTNGWRILVLDTAKPPFDNADFRRALSASIDREAINQIVFNGLEVPATGPIPASSPFYTEADAPLNADVDQAKQLMSESGVSDSSFALTTIARSPEDQLTQLIQAMASEAGIKADIEPVEVGEYLRRNTSGDFEAATMQWSGQADPDANITSFFTTGGYWNWSGYSNPEVDSLLQEAQGTSDVETRKQLYAQALQIVNNDVPVIWLTNQVRLVATTSQVDGVRLMPNTGIMELEDVTLGN